MMYVKSIYNYLNQMYELINEIEKCRTDDVKNRNTSPKRKSQSRIESEPSFENKKETCKQINNLKTKKLIYPKPEIEIPVALEITPNNERISKKNKSNTQNNVDNNSKISHVKVASIDLKLTDSPINYDCTVNPPNSIAKSLKSIELNTRQTPRLKIFTYSSKKKKSLK